MVGAERGGRGKMGEGGQGGGQPTCVQPSFTPLLDLLKGRQLLHTTYKMFMAAAGVEGEV